VKPNKPVDIVIAVLKYIQEVEPDLNFLELTRDEQEDIIAEALEYNE
jgi:hypothetical protein